MIKKMQRYCLFIGLLLCVVHTAFLSNAYGCEISFGESPVRVAANGTATVNITVLREHRRCPLGCSALNIEGEGIKIIRVDAWKDDARKSLCTTTVVVKLVKNEGMLRVWRECEKKGLSEGSVKVIRGK